MLSIYVTDPPLPNFLLWCGAVELVLEDSVLFKLSEFFELLDSDGPLVMQFKYL